MTHCGRSCDACDYCISIELGRRPPAEPMTAEENQRALKQLLEYQAKTSPRRGLPHSKE